MGTTPTSVLTQTQAKARSGSQPCIFTEMFVSCPCRKRLSLGKCPAAAWIHACGPRGLCSSSSLLPAVLFLPRRAGEGSAGPPWSCARWHMCQPCCLELPQSDRALVSENEGKSGALKAGLRCLAGLRGQRGVFVWGEGVLCIQELVLEEWRCS